MIRRKQLLTKYLAIQLVSIDLTTPKGQKNKKATF